MRSIMLALVAGGLALAASARAETVQVGLLKTVGAGPIFIAEEKGYFAAEGLEVKNVVFDSAEPIAVAVVSGSIDIGATGLTAGFYTLAGQGALKMIASESFERPGFQGQAVLASNRAWSAGLTSLSDLSGHSVAISQIGGAPHYSLGLLEEKFGIDPKSVRVLPLQSNVNRIAAVTGGTADSAIIPVTYAMPSIQKGDAKLLGWVGDYTPWQVAAVFTSTKAANERGDMLKRFLRAQQHGLDDYRAAFIGPDEKLQFGPSAPAILAILGKYTGQPEADIRLGITYLDPQSRIDVNDVERQIAWFRAQGMVKGDFDATAVIDRRYAIPLPER
ncbi:MAG TPA: ABC transporter substrate-binding protein [Stellaceae bacterium]|nr:ABC transporter substrate-binding protein [Stellaceae bacterium]